MMSPIKNGLAALSLLLAGSNPGAAGDAIDFDGKVAPLLARKCLDCHSGSDPKGKLDLSRQSSALAGGLAARQSCRVSPTTACSGSEFRPTKCRRLRRLTTARRRYCGHGSPQAAGWGTDPIDTFQTTTARRAGRDWWSLQPLTRHAPPAVRYRDWVRTPIDRFILKALEANGIAPTPEANRRTLIRRVCFDLTGLPPEPEAVDAFVDDDSPGAYSRMLEQYLASPQYGVRWARWWLDLARYGESNGYEFDEFRPAAWLYRDWVVDSLNHDRPYDEFARLQLAGDVLRPNDSSAIAATGFLVAGAYDTVGQTQQSLVMRAVVRSDEIEDLVGTVGQTFLGVTVNCGAVTTTSSTRSGRRNIIASRRRSPECVRGSAISRRSTRPRPRSERRSRSCNRASWLSSARREIRFSPDVRELIPARPIRSPPGTSRPGSWT